MRFSADDVRHVAGLARLRIDPASAERFADELTRILAYVDQLGPADVGSEDSPADLPRRADIALRADPAPLLAESAGRTDVFVAVPPVMSHAPSDLPAAVGTAPRDGDP